MALTTKYCLDFFKRAAEITISKLEVKFTHGIWVFFMKNHMYLIFFIYRSGILPCYIQNHALQMQKKYSSHAGYLEY